MGPTVTVVIPFYNCPYIGQAVESVLMQTYPHVEIIVVDDGSTAYQHLLAPYRSRIHYIGKANAGTASALNYGMQLASGKYVAWLSSDDRFVPWKIERQVHHMELTGARFCHTNYHEMDATGAVTKLNAGVVYPTARQFAASFLEICPVNGCTVMMTKALMGELGWFDESLPYTHDYDLWIRTLLSGIDLHYINEPLTFYRRHPGMGSVRHLDSVLREVHIVRERYRHLLEHKVMSIPC